MFSQVAGRFGSQHSLDFRYDPARKRADDPESEAYVRACDTCIVKLAYFSRVADEAMPSRFFDREHGWGIQGRVFLSTDESRLGRIRHVCTTSQDSQTVLVTVCDSSLDENVTCDIARSVCDAIAACHRRVRIQYCDDMSLSMCVTAHHLQQETDFLVKATCARLSVALAGCDALPKHPSVSLTTMFEDAPGPVTSCSDNAVSFGAGRVVVTFGRPRKRVPSLATDGPRCVIVLDAPAAQLHAPRVHIEADPDADLDLGGGVTCVVASGVPAHHVAAVSHTIVDETGCLSSSSADIVRDLIEHAHSTRSMHHESGLREKRARAESVLANAIDRHMHTIKARLWRPDGPLVQDKLRRDLEHNCT